MTLAMLAALPKSIIFDTFLDVPKHCLAPKVYKYNVFNYFLGLNDVYMIFWAHCFVSS